MKKLSSPCIRVVLLTTNPQEELVSQLMEAASHLEEAASQLMEAASHLEEVASHLEAAQMPYAMWPLLMLLPKHLELPVFHQLSPLKTSKAKATVVP